MKNYEPATLVELGNASELVLGLSGSNWDNIDPPEPQPPETLLDVDE